MSHARDDAPVFICFHCAWNAASFASFASAKHLSRACHPSSAAHGTLAAFQTGSNPAWHLTISWACIRASYQALYAHR